jgi:hypothetical protein
MVEYATKMTKTTALIFANLLGWAAVTAQQPRVPVFKSLPANETGIAFSNTLKESPTLNIITY